MMANVNAFYNQHIRLFDTLLSHIHNTLFSGFTESFRLFHRAFAGRYSFHEKMSIKGWEMA